MFPFSFTCEWLGNVFLIDVYDFQPSILVKINGVLKNYIRPLNLYKVYVIVEGSRLTCKLLNILQIGKIPVTETSGLILFTSRVLLIVDLYRPHPSIQRKICEFLIYCVVFSFGMWAIPMIVWQLPNQHSAKLEVIQVCSWNTFKVHKNLVQNHEAYPDSIWDSNVVVITLADSVVDNTICALIVVNCVSIGFAIFVSAKIAFYMLSQRMINQSKATMKMHKKFNERTILQVSFCTKYPYYTYTHIT